MTFESLTSTLILNPASVLSTGQWLWSSLVALIHPFIQLHCYNILIDIFIVSKCDIQYFNWFLIFGKGVFPLKTRSIGSCGS